MPQGGIRTHNHRKRAVTDPCLRPLGHWDRRGTYTESQNKAKRKDWLRDTVEEVLKILT